MGRVKTKEEKEAKSIKKSKEGTTRRLILMQNDEIMRLNNLVSQLSDEIINFVNLVALSNKVFVSKKGNKEEKETISKAYKGIVNQYLKGDENNFLQMKVTTENKKLPEKEGALLEDCKKERIKEEAKEKKNTEVKDEK